MSKKILITRPEHDDTTHYLSNLSSNAIKIANKKGVTVLDLNRERANKKEVEGMLKKQEPELVFLNGHGGDNIVTGHKNEILIEGGNNENLLKEKITYAISCKSAKKLGRKSIDSGARAYIGYEDDFIFFYDPKKITTPLVDKTAELFLKPAIEVMISLIKGNTTDEATEKSKQLFRNNMKKLLSTEVSEEDVNMAKYIWWNIRNQVCLGDKDSVF